MHRIRLRALAAVCFAGLTSVALPVRGQQGDAARTYTVKKGDTLWDIAKALLGDSYLWPEIYRLNTGTIEDPHWIYPGEVLRLRGASVAVTTRPATPVPETVIEVRRQAPTTTIFDPRNRVVQTRQRESFVIGKRSTAVRAGEYEASPFMWSVGGPKNAGLIQLTAESQGINMTLENRPLQLQEPMFIKLPAGMRGEVGDRMLTFRLGEIVYGQGQVVIPTGMVRLIAPAKDGIAQARLTLQLEDVFTGQGAIPLDTLVMPPNTFPKGVEGGLSTKVTWMHNAPVLPTTGQYVILAAGAKDGLMPGDQVSLRRIHSEVTGGKPRAEEEVGVAQVTRVTPWGASAIVMVQQQVGIVDGMRALVTAKMP